MNGKPQRYILIPVETPQQVPQMVELVPITDEPQQEQESEPESSAGKQLLFALFICGAIVVALIIASSQQIVFQFVQ